MTADSQDAVFRALGSRSRRRILDILKAEPGISVGDVAQRFAVSRIMVLKHLQALERAGLVVSRRQGRVRRLYFNAVPIQMIYDRWTSEYSRLWASGLTRLKYRLEERGKRRG